MDAQTRPFDDIRALIGQMPKADEAAREREAELTKPAGSLGRLEETRAAVMSREGQARGRRTGPLPAPWLERAGGRGNDV